jgi:hypothetical protein
MALPRNRLAKSDVLLPSTHRREKVVGGRLLHLLEDQLASLRAQPVHGNRKLLADHILVAHLIAFFNPVVASLRTLEDVFEHKSVRRRVGSPRVPKSTLSDAQRVFDLELLQPLVQNLVRRIGKLPHDSRLDKVARKIVAVDASVFEVAARIAWALPHNTTSSRGAIQWCLHLDVVDGAPDGFTLIGGQESERAELPKAIAPNRLYLLDRAYQSYAHLGRIVEIGSDFAVRLRSTARFTVQETRPLTLADRRAGVLRDRVVTPAQPSKRFSVPVRLVEITDPEGAPDAEPVRLLTNRLDLPAELIGLLYRHRWQIELFFRWIKCVTQLRHFFSESPKGMALQLYVAMIGTLLIALETGSRPTKYDFAQMSLVTSGMVSLDDAKQVMARRRAERTRAAQWQTQYRAAKKASR